MGIDQGRSRKNWWVAFVAAVAAFLAAGLGTGPAEDPDEDLPD